MRKQSLPSELASLTDEQLAQVHHWLDRFTYSKVQQLFFETFRIRIGAMKLCRYYKRLLKARALSTAGHTSLTAADLVAIQNGTPLPDERSNTQLLQIRVLDLVHNVKSAYELRELHQVATYEQRRALKERETALAERMDKHRIWRADFRERDLAFRKRKAASRADPPPISPISFPVEPNASSINK
jgi:hypothetical protein